MIRWNTRFSFALPAIAVLAAIVVLSVGSATHGEPAASTTTTVAPATTTSTSTTSTTTSTTTTTTTLPTYLDPAASEQARDTYGKCGEFYDMAISLGWPPEEWKTLSMVMQRESNCQPLAWSGSDAGLMQINRVHTEWARMMGWQWPDDLFIPENNLLFAYRLWTTSGWSPWRFSGEVPSE